MLWDNLGKLRKDWSEDSIKDMFFAKRDKLRKEVMEALCELANSDEYRCHVEDYVPDICDLIHMAEEDGDHRIHSYSAYEEVLEGFGDGDLMAQNVECAFTTLKQVNSFIHEMGWENPYKEDR